MDGIDLSKHYSLTSSQLVDQICSPALKKIGISYFNYLKIHHSDHSRELLTNNAEWIDHFYRHRLYESAGTVDIEHLLPKGYFLWSELMDSDPIYAQGREFFNIDNGISFVIKRKDVTLLYIFASTRNNTSINHLYLRNLDLLKRFILYFNDKASHLIDGSAKNRIYLPNGHRPIEQNTATKFIDDVNKKYFYDEICIDKFYLPSISDDLYLTRKQAECVAYLIEGATAKQCANALGISYRTVESYTHDIKEKITKTTGEQMSKDKLIQFLKGTMIHNTVFPNGVSIDS